MLQTKTITLTNPKNWEDKNDFNNIDEYRKLKDLKTVLALCLTKERETFHHWNVFAHGKAGVSISFFKSKLLRWAESNNLNYGEVVYKKRDELLSEKPSIDELLFIKRWAYKDEVEVRIIYEDKEMEYSIKDFKIDLNLIKRIRISPWLPKKISESVVKIIRSIDGCESIEVYRTTLVDNVYHFSKDDL